MSAKIETHLDVVLAQRKRTSKELAEAIGISEQAVSMFRSGKAKGVRFSTLSAMCDFLNCQPGDLLSYSQHDEGSS